MSDLKRYNAETGEVEDFVDPRDQTIAELRSLAPCGKHPKQFEIIESEKDGVRWVNCSICKEIAELRESLQEAITAIGYESPVAKRIRERTLAKLRAEGNRDFVSSQPKGGDA